MAQVGFVSRTRNGVLASRMDAGALVRAAFHGMASMGAATLRVTGGGASLTRGRGGVAGGGVGGGVGGDVRGGHAVAAGLAHVPQPLRQSVAPTPGAAGRCRRL